MVKSLEVNEDGRTDVFGEVVKFSVPLSALCLLRNSLRCLCVLGVSAVKTGRTFFNRRDAENAEAQRI